MPSETISQFHDRLVAVGKVSFTDDDDAQKDRILKEAFLRGLRSSRMSGHIKRREPRGFLEAIRMATLEEQINSSEKDDQKSAKDSKDTTDSGSQGNQGQNQQGGNKKVFFKKNWNPPQQPTVQPVPQFIPVPMPPAAGFPFPPPQVRTVGNEQGPPPVHTG